MTATFDSSADEGTTGVILAWGSLFGGLVIYVTGGRVCYEYVYSESVKHTMSAPFAQRSGRRTIQVRFERTAVRAGTAILAVDGMTAAAVEIPRTWPVHGTTAGLTCGQDAGAPVSDAYQRPYAFTGRNLRVTIELDSDAKDDSGAAYRTALKEQ